MKTTSDLNSLSCFRAEHSIPILPFGSCEPNALASGINRMLLDLAAPGPKPDATPDASAFGSQEPNGRIRIECSARKQLNEFKSLVVFIDHERFWLYC